MTWKILFIVCIVGIMGNFHQVEGVLENDLYQSRGKTDNLGIERRRGKGLFLKRVFKRRRIHKHKCVLIGF